MLPSATCTQLAKLAARAGRHPRLACLLLFSLLLLGAGGGRVARRAAQNTFRHFYYAFDPTLFGRWVGMEGARVGGCTHVAASLPCCAARQLTRRGPGALWQLAECRCASSLPPLTQG